MRTRLRTRSTSSSSVSTARTSTPSRSRRFGNSGPGSAAMRPACPASRKSCAPSSPTPLRSNGLLTVQPPPQQKLQPPTRHRAQRKRRGIRPKKIDPQTYSKALWVGWQEVDDPPSGEVDAGLLGGILRDKFGAGLSSITDEQLNHTAKFTIVGIRPAEYERGMRLTRQHTARGWRVTWAESKKQPFTPWVPDPDRDHPPRKTHRGSRGKQRRPRDPDDQVDLTAT